MNFTLEEVSHILQGTLHSVAPQTSVTQISIDSRNISPGDLFFCIQGQRTDGHDYISNAIEQGACAIVANPQKVPQRLQASECPAIWVSSPNQSLLDLAKAYREQFNGKVLGITGSNGKTSTKELAIQLLRYLGCKVHGTPGNYNNQIGVPLTLFQASLDEDWWVIEMGTNQPGEISLLSKVAQPHVGILCNIGESHLELLKSTEGVAHEKSGLFDGMPAGAHVWVPSDLKHLDIVQRIACEQHIELQTYGWAHTMPEAKEQATLSSQGSTNQTSFDWNGTALSTSLTSPLLLKNLLGVLGATQEAVPSSEILQKAVEQLQPSLSNRLNIIHQEDYDLVDDTYNANPTSFEAVILDLKHQYPQRRMMVVAGAMAELGDISLQAHQDVGAFLKRHVHALFVKDDQDMAKHYLDGWPEAFCSDSVEALIQQVQQERQPGDLILVKGSRAARMEQVIQALNSSS